jgi:signal transduction histidine kinase
LKLRIFLTIFAVLALTSFSTSYIHFHFFKLERLRLIDQNLEQHAGLLGRINFMAIPAADHEQAERVIEETIGDDKVNMIVGIYDRQGRLRFSNENADIFELPDQLPARWKSQEDIEKRELLLKYFTSARGPGDQIIKVGMVLNQSLLSWDYLKERVGLLAAIIMLLTFMISFLLTYLLFRPINQLSEQVNRMASKLETGKFADLKSWFGIVKGLKKDDAFNNLVLSLDRLANRIMENQMLTQKWSALMAHELKTPMTTLKISVENLLRTHSLPAEKVIAVEQELTRLERIIMDFLEWASAENDTSRPDLHVINLPRRTEEVVSSLQIGFPQIRLVFRRESEEEQRVFCNPIHFDQVLHNLITNAIKYGEDGIVEISLGKGFLKVADHGPGIPVAVMENYGHPFNNYKQGESKGHGLGLAWVNTIAKKYGWDIRFETSRGTTVTIHFGELIET